MIKQPIWIILIICMLIVISPVSAATCSFINITQGEPGSPGINGTNATVAIGTVSSGSPTSVTNVGTPSAAILDFVIEPGADGLNGSNGADGDSATITVGTVTSGAVASVTNVGTPLDAVFDFVMQKGDKGDDGYTPVFGVDYFNGSNGAPGANGSNGTAATINVNATFTLAAGSSATVTNIGDTTAALFNFGIPVGATGAQGEKGDTGDIPDVSQFLFLNGTRAMTENLSMGTKHINGLATPSVSTDAATKGYVDTAVAGVSNYNASYATITYVGEVNTSMKAYVDARPDSTYNASYWTGTNYNSSYITSTYNSTYDAKPSSTYNATYDAKPSSTYNATYDAKPSSTYNATYDAKAPATVSGYVTLMAGSAMITTTNPVAMSQTETSTNKNNYISIDFTNGGSEVGQWIVDFPADWNSASNVQFTPIWTAASGSGTINFTVKAKLFPDDAALDTALAQVGSSSVDTLLTAGDVHVAPATSAAAITSVSSGGNTAIIAINRNSAAADDTVAATINLIGLRVKYSRTVAA